MLKALLWIAVGTQVGPYVNPYIGKYVFDPLLSKLHEIDIREIEKHVNDHRGRA